MAIASTNLTHLVGQYCNLSNYNNSWCLSWNWFTSMVTFHCPHQSERAFSEIVAQKQTGTLWWMWWMWFWRNCRLITLLSATVYFNPGNMGQLYLILNNVALGFHLHPRGHSQNCRWKITAHWKSFSPLPWNPLVMDIDRYILRTWKTIVFKQPRGGWPSWNWFFAQWPNIWAYCVRYLIVKGLSTKGKSIAE